MKTTALLTALASVALLTSQSAHAATVYGITASNQLLAFDSTTPGTITSSASVTGLAAGEVLLGIDFRPATFELYGLGSGSRLYRINQATGAATQVGSDGLFTLSGSAFGFDFNPMVDRVRVVSNTEQNLRLNPNDGSLTATDGMLSPAGNVVGSAYTNNFANAPSTMLYGIDSVAGTLVLQNPPNNGTLVLVGSLGVGALGENLGFDIFGNDVLASLNIAGAATTGLYRINLNTGAAALIGSIGGGNQVTDIAIQTIPEPGTVVLTLAGLGALVVRRIRG